MKAWEICKEENVGKSFKDNLGTIWEVFRVVLSTGTYYDLRNNLDEVISISFYMSCLAELDFEEVVDWSKVPVDTKILVSNCINGAGEVIEWRKRYFAKYENGKIYAWNDGVTSFSVDSDDLCTRWDFVKLYKEEN